MLPLAASAISAAAPVLALLVKVAPKPPMVLAAPLSGPIKALAKCVDAAQAMHAALVAAATEWHSETPNHTPTSVATAQGHISVALGSLVALLHR